MRIGLVGTGRIGSFHATTLQALDGVDTVLVADADAGRARALAAATGLEAVPDVDALYTEGVDALVVTAATSAHAALVHQALDREVPVFCEKPVALDVPGTREVVDHAQRSGIPVQVGFQRRFDLGYRAARQALLDGDLGWLHTVRAVTGDESPPPAAYIPTSGGLFRDCSIHDFDILRWVTGREVVSVSAFGANRGAPFFAEAGDVDTCAALLRFDDDLLGTVTATRYNGAGHDVRLELCGSKDARFVGLDDRAPMPTAERSVSWQRAGPTPASWSASTTPTPPSWPASSTWPQGARSTPARPPRPWRRSTSPRRASCRGTAVGRWTWRRSARSQPAPDREPGRTARTRQTRTDGGQTRTPSTEQRARSITVWAVLPSTSLPTAERFFSPTTTRLAFTASAAARISSAASPERSRCCTSTSTPSAFRSATSRISADVCG